MNKFLSTLSPDEAKTTVVQELEEDNNKISFYGDGRCEITSKEDEESRSVTDFTRIYDSGQYHSEGLEREIQTIRLPKSFTVNNPQAVEELKAIGKIQGFEVEIIDIVDKRPWIEDYQIPTKSGVYMDNYCDSNIMYESMSSLDVRYSENTALQGGNVLQTFKADGTPAAIIGQDCISASLEHMSESFAEDLSEEEKIEATKLQIAQNLEYDPENITYIPNFVFHIDMCYRPLKNGEMAVPDYESAIEILETQDIEGMSAETKEELKNNLKQVYEKHKEEFVQAEQILQDAGYTIKKIPDFSTTALSTETRAGFKTNHMNGVGGTNSDTGETYYITNKSEYSGLDAIVSEYFKQAGIDNVYFISTTESLDRRGGIDCLTQEILKYK